MARRIIDRATVAILYEIITGQCQKRGSIHCTGDDKIDIDEFLAAHPGLNAVLVPRAALPFDGLADKCLEDDNERFFRQTIADHTKTAYFPRGADRSIMVDHSTGEVVSIHLGNVPGLDRPDPGHQLISHMTAEVGHRWNGVDFVLPDITNV
jgi:hypothetical protein